MQGSVVSDIAKPSRQLGFGFACCLVVLVCIGLGLYFCALQNLLYSHYQPFYDSVGYYDQLHAVMLTGQQKGLAEAVIHAFDSGTTVFMPFFIGSLISWLVEPSRNLGVWIQIVELQGLLLSVLYYFCKVRSVRPAIALLMLTPFVLTTCLYRNNGGLSDFRMDLSLYIGFATSCTWYLIAATTLRRLHFVLLGVAIAVTCLFRATAPVYFILGLGPIVLWDLVRHSHRKRLLAGLMISCGLATAGSVWFFLLHFNDLYYYYFVWNIDANAKLPISQSLLHVEFAFRQIGDQFLIWFCCINVLVLFANREKGVPLTSTIGKVLANAIPHYDIRLLWLAAAPLLMLVLRGAGLNQFVCLPAIAGILLLTLQPIVANRKFTSQRHAVTATAVVSLICLGSVLLEGWDKHRPGDHNSMQAHQTTIRTIVNDAKKNGLRFVNYGTTHVYYLNSSSLGSTIRFDVDDSEIIDGRVFVDEVQMIKNGVFSGIVADADWNRLEGKTEAEKLERLLHLANTRVDYLIVPNNETIDFLEQDVAFNIINRHQNYVARHIVGSENWVPIGDPIVNREHETVRLYRNVWKTRVAQGLDSHSRPLINR
jgi:hypothetical protein